MGLFGFGKKKEEKQESCGCGSAPKAEEMAMCDCGNMCKVSDIEAAKKAKNADETGCAVKVLGSGCKKCNDLEAAVKAALGEMGKSVEVEHVTDFNKIAAFGVMTTPALVVNNKVVSMGKVLKKDEAIKLLETSL